MTKKVSLILWIVLCLFLAALLSRKGAFAIMAIPFVVLLGAGWIESPRNTNLHAVREISTCRCNENDPFKMQLTVENNGAAIPRLQATEPALPGMHLLENNNAQSFTLDVNKQVTLNYVFQASRGRYSWQTARFIVSDPFGLFEKHIEVEAQARLSVQPDTLMLQHFKYQPLPNIRTAGTNLSRLPGSGTDFWGVREYHPGDSMRSIQWRISARHPRSFYTKVYEREEMADIGLLLDARVIANHICGAETLLEYSIQAAATLARYSISAGNRVSMLILNDHLVRVFPGYGKHQLIRILDELAACSPGKRVSFNTLRYLPVKLFPGHSVILLISPLLPEDFKTIHQLQAEGYQLLVVSPNPASFLSNLPDHSYDVLANRAFSLERAVLIRQLQKKGVQIIDWDVTQSLIKTLHSTQFVKM